MLHAGQQARLTFKLLSHRRLGRKRLFKGNGFSESLVYGFINCAHATAAQLPDNAIAFL